MTKIPPIGSRNNPAPSVDEYLRALSLVNLTDIRTEMLRIHLQRPRHTITATQMAKAMGRSSHGYANLQYGSFAATIVKHLRKAVPADHDAVTAIVTLHRPSVKSQWRWTMHPAFAEAVKQLNLGAALSEKKKAR